MNDDIEAKNCTLCGQDNQCGNLQSGSKEPCWCVKESFPEGYLSLSMSRVPYFLSKK
ncbi:cysteine-rich CWC family protein [Ammoniphilus sp. CFH 90114]|uniref:cysteine-rich CWC family protein n=1 Tax=Ammoniphilus sp. CFH 90114 TaxID=2493665 RepID=UPI0013E9209A